MDKKKVIGTAVSIFGSIVGAILLIIGIVNMLSSATIGDSFDRHWAISSAIPYVMFGIFVLISTNIAGAIIRHAGSIEISDGNSFDDAFSSVANVIKQASEKIEAEAKKNNGSSTNKPLRCSSCGGLLEENGKCPYCGTKNY